MLTAAGDPSNNPRDPFNWPAMQRKDLMSATGGLSSARDLFHMKKDNIRQKRRVESANLRCDDIEGKLQNALPDACWLPLANCSSNPRRVFLGTKSRVWAKQLNRPEFNLVNEDIQGAGPRMLHVGLNKPEFNLTNADIEGTKT